MAGVLGCSWTPLAASMPTPGDAGAGDAFACPRCQQTVTERFYGPCQSCREALVAQGHGLGRPALPSGSEGPEDAGGVEAVGPRFEPRMNMVPNHVATKE